MPAEQKETASDRRQFLSRTAATGAGVLVGASALEALLPSLADAKRKHGVTRREIWRSSRRRRLPRRSP